VYCRVPRCSWSCQCLVDTAGDVNGCIQVTLDTSVDCEHFHLIQIGAFDVAKVDSYGTAMNGGSSSSLI
jgi:hypothetical protein